METLMVLFLYRLRVIVHAIMMGVVEMRNTSAKQYFAVAYNKVVRGWYAKSIRERDMSAESNGSAALDPNKRFALTI